MFPSGIKNGVLAGGKLELPSASMCPSDYWRRRMHRGAGVPFGYPSLPSPTNSLRRPTNRAVDPYVAAASHSTVTLLARFLGLSTSVPRAQAV